MTREIDRELERAERALAVGHIDGAIEALRRVLTFDPDFADAHAWLAICLLRKRRLHAAAIEAERALTLGPESPLSQRVGAEIEMARRRFKEAERHVDQLIAMTPMDASALRLRARLFALTGRERQRLPVLGEALAKDPADAATLADLASYHCDVRDSRTAQRYAEEALRLEPENQSALVAMGQALLLAGDVAGAREHALLALRVDATDVGALHLMSSIKARSNPLLGLWWRYATWASAIGTSRQILVLLGAFVLYRVGAIAMSQAGNTGAAGVINIVWLAIVVYSFAGPQLFRNALQRELAGVELKRF